MQSQQGKMSKSKGKSESESKVSVVFDTDLPFRCLL